MTKPNVKPLVFEGSLEGGFDEGQMIWLSGTVVETIENRIVEHFGLESRPPDPRIEQAFTFPGRFRVTVERLS